MYASQCNVSRNHNLLMLSVESLVQLPPIDLVLIQTSNSQGAYRCMGGTSSGGGGDIVLSNVTPKLSLICK